MKKITITIILAMLMALMVSPALAAVNVATVQYDGACTTSTVAVSSGTVSVVLTAVKDFNITYSGESAGAVTITIDANSFDIIRTAVPVIEILYTGGATACTATIAADTLTLTRDANATNTTYDLTNANYNTIAEVVAAIAARDDFNCTVYGTTYNAFTSADLVDMEATSCKTALDLTFSGTQTWDITNAAYNTRGEMITALSAVTDITIVEWDGDDDSVATAFVDASTQDITTLFTVTTTETLTYTVATYKTFGELEDAMESRDDISVTPYSDVYVQARFETLATAPLDDLGAADIKGTTATLAAGGTIDDSFSPYYKISGTLDDVLFCMQLRQPTKWYVAYESSGTIYVIGGP